MNQSEIEAQKLNLDKNDCAINTNSTILQFIKTLHRYISNPSLTIKNFSVNFLNARIRQTVWSGEYQE